MNKLFILLIALICSLVVTPKYAYTHEEPLGFADIHIAPIFNVGVLGPFGGYIGGSGDFSDFPTAMDWSIGNTVPLSLTRTDDMVFSTTIGSWVNPPDWKERMRITKNGKVGIGTATPEAKLHVVGAHPLLIDNTGSPFNDSILFRRFGVNQYSLGVTNEPSFSLYDQVAQGFRFTITSNGNFGIGTATPQGKLDINGSLAIEGDTGTTGQVLTSQGASAPVWAAPSAKGLTVGGGQVFDSTESTQTAWATLDLSSVVGANHAFVILRINNISLGNSTHLAFRQKGDTKDYEESSRQPSTNTTYIRNEFSASCQVITYTDSNGQIEMKAEKVTSGISIDVAMYIL